jgi:5'-nucleotidase
MIFDRVTSVEVEEADGTFRPLERKKLYRVAANLYMAGMIGYVSRASKGILKLEPKDAEGRPVTEMKRMIVDADPAAAGVQEIKEWAALAGFLRSFPDPDGNGLPEIPASYASPAGRIKVEPSWNPIALLSGAHAPTLVVLGLVVGLILTAVLVIRAVRRRRARRAH